MTETLIKKYRCNACDRTAEVETGSDERGFGSDTKRGAENVRGWVYARFNLIDGTGDNEGVDGLACFCDKCREKLGVFLFSGRLKE